MKHLYYSDNNENNSNTDLNREIIFKKKTLKNSFSIHSRKKKDKKDSINNSNKSIMENTNFQIISDKRFETSVNEKSHNKLNSTMSNINNTYNIDIKKDNEILNEIKVKKRDKFIIAENKYNNNSVLNKYLTKKNLETNINDLRDNYSKKAKKDIKMKRLLTITRLINNKGKIEISKSNVNNNSLINERKNKLNETAHEKEIFIDNYKNKNLSSKRDRTNHPSNEKKIKEIFLMENTGRKVKVYKTDNSNTDKIKSKKTFIKNSSQKQNIIKRNNNHLKENKTNEYINEYKTQRKKDILNYLLTKK
jgi:hypothetical protein